MSEQSGRGTQMLHSRYAHTFANLHRDRTYLFEIIYPQNKIVVNYGDREDLILLAVIDNLAGQDYPLDDYIGLGFPVVKRFTGLSALDKLKSDADNPANDNSEGYVVRFRSGLRIKSSLPNMSGCTVSLRACRTLPFGNTCRRVEILLRF